MVRLTIGETDLELAEEVDWGERGVNIVRGELRAPSDAIASLGTRLGLDAQSTAKMEMSLVTLATEIRDRVLEGAPQPVMVLFSDLLTPCPECGDVRLWNGVCLNCEAHKANHAQLEDERKRLFQERDAILKDRESALERLPVLRRRLAESAAAIEKSHSGAGG